MDIKTVLIILHLLGAAIGAGSAVASDVTFLRNIRDGVVDQKEHDRLRKLSRFVWIGLTILFVSGVGLFLTDPNHYLSSSKFQAKMTIVGILIANGLIFHFVHLPRLSDGTWARHQRPLMMSGVVSFTSWTSAFILGFLHSTPLTYGAMMGIYLTIVLGGVFIGFLLQPFLFSKRS